MESAKKEAEQAKKNIDHANTNTEVQKAKNDGVGTKLEIAMKCP